MNCSRGCENLLTVHYTLISAFTIFTKVSIVSSFTIKQSNSIQGFKHLLFVYLMNLLFEEQGYITPVTSR